MLKIRCGGYGSPPEPVIGPAKPDPLAGTTQERVGGASVRLSLGFEFKCAANLRAAGSDGTSSPDTVVRWLWNQISSIRNAAPGSTLK